MRGEIIEFGRRDIHDIGRDDVWTPEPGHAPKIVYLPCPGGTTDSSVELTGECPADWSRRT